MLYTETVDHRRYVSYKVRVSDLTRPAKRLKKIPCARFCSGYNSENGHLLSVLLIPLCRAALTIGDDIVSFSYTSREHIAATRQVRTKTR